MFPERTPYYIIKDLFEQIENQISIGGAYYLFMIYWAHQNFILFNLIQSKQFQTIFLSLWWCSANQWTCFFLTIEHLIIFHCMVNLHRQGERKMVPSCLLCNSLILFCSHHDSQGYPGPLKYLIWSALK